MNRHFIEDSTQKTNKDKKRPSKSLAIREMPMKTLIRSHRAPLRVAKI